MHQLSTQSPSNQAIYIFRDANNASRRIAA